SSCRAIRGSSRPSSTRSSRPRRATATRCSRASCAPPGLIAQRSFRKLQASEGGRHMKLAGHDVGIEHPFFLIAGPCVVESQTLVEGIAGMMKELTTKLGIPYIFKASFDKANRSSKDSFRGPGMDAGLKVLEGVKHKIGVPVLTDVHEDTAF